METTFTVYEQTLRQLAQLLGQTYTDAEWQEMIDRKIDGTNINRSMKVAGWANDFFTHFINRQEVDYVLFEEPDHSTVGGDSWIALASVILPGEWEYEGEYRSVAFEPLRFEGYINYEGNHYEISSY